MRGSNDLFFLEEKKELIKGFNVRAARDKKAIFIVLLIFLFLIFFSVYFYTVRHRVDLLIADYTEVVDGFWTEGLLIRDEIVYRSPDSGFVKLLASEGKRVAYGEEIAGIANRIIYNRHAGLLSYATDGLEEELTIKNISDINIDKYKSYRRNFKQNFNNEYIRKGQALFRIVKNNNMYLVIPCAREEIRRYRVNETVFIQADELGKGLIEATVVEKKNEEEQGFLIIRLNFFLEEWLNTRRVNFLFIKNIHRGIAIPREAIFTTTAGEGVLIYDPVRNNYSFVQIRVLNGNRELVIVEGVDLGSHVVTNPEVLDYGRGV
ncbi:MAG: hypothetical protein GX336_06065 [Halanaerobiaceae bacterium]|nr:hypothetical protein [Halanaerobiaceae bacterium]